MKLPRVPLWLWLLPLPIIALVIIQRAMKKPRQVITDSAGVRWELVRPGTPADQIVDGQPYDPPVYLRADGQDIREHTPALQSAADVAAGVRPLMIPLG